MNPIVLNFVLRSVNHGKTTMFPDHPLFSSNLSLKLLEAPLFLDMFISFEF